MTSDGAIEGCIVFLCIYMRCMLNFFDAGKNNLHFFQPLEVRLKLAKFILSENLRCVCECVCECVCMCVCECVCV